MQRAVEPFVGALHYLSKRLLLRTDVRLKRLEIPDPHFSIGVSDDELIVQRRGQKANGECVGTIRIECREAALRIRRQLA